MSGCELPVGVEDVHLKIFFNVDVNLLPIVCFLLFLLRIFGQFDLVFMLRGDQLYLQAFGMQLIIQFFL